MEKDKEKEICINAKPFMQPTPVKNIGGDCFACVFTGIMKHLFPEKDVSFDYIFDLFRGKYYMSEKECINNHWPYYKNIFNKIKNDGFNIEYKADIVLPDFSDIETFQFSFYIFNNHGEFFNRIFNLLSEKWLLIFSIDNDAKGSRYYHFDDNKYYNNYINHLVFIDGAKSVWEPVGDGCSTLRHYIHVVCSAKGTYWAELRDFTNLYGASAWWQVRRIN